MAEEGKARDRSRSLRLDLGNLTVNFENSQVHVDRRPIDLTMQEFEALRVLLDGLNHILSCEEICASLWQDTDQRRLRSLPVLIHRLRRKLLDTSPFVIKTMRGRGYGLIDTRPPSRKRSARHLNPSGLVGLISAIAILA